eukprot:scaffold1508_cov110-Isochrysis_galbana.AAC.1
MAVSQHLGRIFRHKTHEIAATARTLPLPTLFRVAVGFVGVLFNLFLPNECGDRAGAGVVEDDRVYFGFHFGRWSHLSFASASANLATTPGGREVVRVRRPDECGRPISRCWVGGVQQTFSF